MNVVVVGTGTEVGKTHVACLLLKEAARQGIRVKAVKPVESGCSGEAEEDGALLASASGQEAPARALVRLEAPLAPPVAADLEGVELDAKNWVATIKSIAECCEILVIETAGGLLSPLTWKADATNLARDLKASALVVASNRLGCVHEVRSAVSILRQHSIPIVSVVLNTIQADVSSEHNPDTLMRILPRVPMVFLPRTSSCNASQTRLAISTILQQIRAHI